jgi:hypothetical protein
MDRSPLGACGAEAWSNLYFSTALKVYALQAPRPRRGSRRRRRTRSRSRPLFSNPGLRERFALPLGAFSSRGIKV